VGGIIAVAEAARNLVCSGAQPLAITDCLNFGNPEKDGIYYQLKECIRGIARACRKLQIPVISGNVSLYNETKGEAVYPTPVVGMLGIMEDVERHCSMSFKRAGDLVFVLGPVFPCGDYAVSYCGLGASEYLELVHGLVKGKPSIDLNMEKKVQRCCLEAIRRGIVRSAHDSSEGGLLVAIAESCIAGDIGFEGKGWSVKGRLDAFFFGECQSRIVVSVPEDGMVKLAEVAERWQVPLTFLGTVGGKRLTIEGYIDLPVAEIAKAWYSFPS
jgi:phosphoribosylformylglycinamidine synthase